MPVTQKPRGVPSQGFDDRQLTALTQAFGLRGVDALKPIILDGTHASMLDVRSETSRKALLDHGDETWFVKQVPWYADDPAHLARRHAALARVAARTDLVPRLLSTGDGVSWAWVDGMAFEVSEYRSGLRFTRSVRQVHAAGAALAELHVALPDVAPTEDYRDLVADHVRLARGATGNGGPTELLAVLEAAAAELGTLLPGREWSQLPPTFVHGDFNPWNVVFGHGDEAVAVVDFDNCDTGTRLRDLVEGWLTHSAVTYRGDSTSFAVPFRCEPDTVRSEAFLSGYFGAGTPRLTVGEVACLPGMVRAVHVELVSLAILRGEIGDESAAEVAAWQAYPPLPDVGRFS